MRRTLAKLLAARSPLSTASPSIKSPRTEPKASPVQISPQSQHRFVAVDQAMDWLRLGWLPLPTLDGTHHGAGQFIWLGYARAWPDVRLETRFSGGSSDRAEHSGDWLQIAHTEPPVGLAIILLKTRGMVRAHAAAQSASAWQRVRLRWGLPLIRRHASQRSCRRLRKV